MESFLPLTSKRLAAIALLTLTYTIFGLNFFRQGKATSFGSLRLVRASLLEQQQQLLLPYPQHQPRQAIFRANATKTPSSFETLHVVTQDVRALLEGGGVYMYDTAALLAAVGAQPHLYRSRALNPGWVPTYDQYSIELTFIRLLQESSFLTQDPAKARLFIVPQYGLNEVHHCLFLEDRALSPTLMDECRTNVTQEYLMPLLKAVQSGPWFQRHGGKDHLFVFPWDMAWRLFPGAPELLANASYFGYYKDTDSAIIIPAPVPNSFSPAQTMRNLVQSGSTLEHAAARLKHPVGSILDCEKLEEVSRWRKSDLDKEEWVWAPERTWLASFFGTVHPVRSYSMGIRQDLLALLGEGRGLAHGIIFREGHVTSQRYEQAVAHSRFCLCPPGWTPWSQRLYSVIAGGCLPVFFEVPDFNMWRAFEDVVDWEAFSTVIPYGKHLDIVRLLRDIPPDRVCRMRAALAHYAPLLSWSGTPDLPLMLALREAWLRVSQYLPTQPRNSPKSKIN